MLFEVHLFSTGSPYFIALHHLEATWTDKDDRHWIRTGSGDEIRVRETPAEIGAITGGVLHAMFVLRQIGLI